MFLKGFNRIIINILIIPVLLAVAVPSFSEDSVSRKGSGIQSGPEEPSGTDIILPEMYLEIEDLSIEEINAVIPDNDDILLSSIEFKLPEPEDISIPAEIFALNGPSLPSADYDVSGSDKSAFFSEGIIGAGTASNITGDITLYHIGEQPDFMLRFFHDSYDGFAGRTPGEGFSAREELIEAEIDYGYEIFSLEADASYNEIETGLQQKTDYYSATVRSPALSAEAWWGLTELLDLGAGINASMASLRLNSNTPGGFGIFSASPGLDLEFGTDTLKVGAGLDYSVNGIINDSSFTVTDVLQGFGGGLSFYAEASELFRVTAAVDLLWDNWSSLYFPFKVSMAGTTSVFDYEIGGGYKAFYWDRAELWKLSPAAAGPQNTGSLGALPLSSGWFGEAMLRWNLNDILILHTAADFSALNNSPYPVLSSLRGFYTVSTVDSICLGAEAGFFLRFSENFTFSLGWNGQLLNQINWYKPKHRIDTGIEISSEEKNMGLIANAELRIYSQQQAQWLPNDWVPVIGLEGYIGIFDGLVFSVSAYDLAAGLVNGGRVIWGDLLDKGTGVQAKIKISL